VVICLSTPFLIARPRDLGRHAWKQPRRAIAGLVLLPMWIGIRALSPTWWVGLLEFVVLVLVLSLGAGVSVLMLKSWREYGDQLLRELESPKFNRNNTLIIRTPGDEASGGLDFFQLITRITVGFWVRTMSLYERLETTAQRWAKQKTKVIAVTAETTPTGSWTVHLIDPPTTEELGTDVLPLMVSIR
jgi:hypothetical protein